MNIEWTRFSDGKLEHGQQILFTNPGWLTFDLIRAWYDEKSQEVVQQGTGARYQISKDSLFIIVDDLDPQ